MAEILTSICISDEIVHIGDRVQPSIPTAEMIAREQLEQEIDEAFQRGLKQGIAEGLAQAHAKFQEREACLIRLLDSIPEAVEHNRLMLSSEIADIVLFIIQRFFIHQQHSKDAIAGQITSILNQLNQKHNIELALHPHDVALLEQGELDINFKPFKNIRIKADDTLRLGGCIVRSEHGAFDASIERQIDNLKQVLLKIKVPTTRDK